MILQKKRKSSFDEMRLSDTLDFIEELACSFTREIEKFKELQLISSEQGNELLSSETLERYKSSVKVLKYPYKNFRELQIAELNEGFLIQSWSNMGSILESTLQIFLAFYYHDYIKSDANIWNENVLEKLTHLLKNDWNNQLKELVTDSEVDFAGKDREGYIKKIQEILKHKASRQPIEKMTLEPLIAFYISNDIINSEQYTPEEFRRIRDYRNAIHNFQKREIGDWKELNYYGKILLMLFLDISYRLPSLPDEVPLASDIYEIQTKRIMLEQQWFEYSITGEM